MLLSVLLDERRKPQKDQLERIIWTDADSIVMNPEIPIENLLPPGDIDRVHVITTNDIFGLNAGAMMLRVSEFSIELMVRIMAYPHCHQEIHLNAAEQSALERLILDVPEVREKVVRMPQRFFNGYRPGVLEGQNAEHGDLMMHFPGENKKLMGNYLDAVEGPDSAWSKAYQETEYPVAIPAFWDKIRCRIKNGDFLYEAAKSS